jgi:hypothetical protein
MKILKINLKGKCCEVNKESNLHMTKGNFHPSKLQKSQNEQNQSFNPIIAHSIQIIILNLFAFLKS